MMKLIYNSSIVLMMIIFMLITTWFYTEYTSIDVDNDVDFDQSDNNETDANKQHQIKSLAKVTRNVRGRIITNLPYVSSISSSLSLSSLSFSSLTQLSLFSSLLSSPVKDKFRHRNLQSMNYSLKDSQIAFVSSGPLPNDNIHSVSIPHNNNNNNNNNNDIINYYQPKSSSRPYRPKYSTILSKNNHTIRYIHETLCSGCRYEYTSNDVNEKTTTCWHEIEELLNYDNVSMLEAAIIVSELYPNSCERCNPKSCTDNEKKYYRPDDMISNHDIQYARTHFLKSIDANDRIPLNILESNDELNTFLSNPYNLHPHREYFIEFNPSITHLPKSQIPKQLLLLKGEDNTDDSYYVASYRVSNAHFCLREGENNQIRNVDIMSFRSMDYLGIAILDIQLNIVLETVVDIRVVVKSNIPELNNDKLYQDGRLFTLNNQLYLGSFTMLYPIWLVPPMNYYNYDSNNSTESNEIVQIPYYMTAAQKLNKDYDDNEYNTNLLSVYIQRSGYCSNDMNYQLHGKSYNYFYDSNQQRIVLEIYPMGPKEYLNNDCQLSDTSIDFIVPNKPIPLHSYSTTDEVILSYRHGTIYPYHSDRGNYCCLSINVPEYYYPKYTNQTTLLIGISHQLTKAMYDPFYFDWATYFHSFYAMESVAPYNIVARSGRFCLGYPQHDGNDTNTNNEIHFTNPRREVPFKFGPESYDCPKIHFVTGMTEALHDPNQVIISYGVDDCYSRFITISKEHILSLLFNNDNDPA